MWPDRPGNRKGESKQRAWVESQSEREGEREKKEGKEETGFGPNKFPILDVKSFDAN